MKTRHLFLACSLALATASASFAQSKLYPHLFDLQEVTLTDGMFKTALDLNNDLLLQYDVDRLLTPYFRQTGIKGWEEEHPNFPNWGSGSFRLDGHVGMPVVGSGNTDGIDLRICKNITEIRHAAALGKFALLIFLEVVVHHIFCDLAAGLVAVANRFDDNLVLSDEVVDQH